MVDRLSIVVEILRFIQKEEARVKFEGFLKVLTEEVKAFETTLNRIFKDELPNFWGERGNLMLWDQYEKILVAAKRKTYSTHEISTMSKGQMIVNYLKIDFELLGYIKGLFRRG